MSTQTLTPPDERLEGIHVAVVLRCMEDGVLLDLPTGAIKARILTGLVSVSPSTGQSVAVVFEGGDPQKPLVLGPIGTGAPCVVAVSKTDAVVTSDTEAAVISHPRKLVLQCGRSSITLEASGRISLDGETIVSTAAKLNRVVGAAVKLN